MTRKEALFALLVALLVTALCATVIYNLHSESPRQMHLFLTPHPDDELQGLTTLSTDNTTYTLVVTATQGEATRNCRLDGYPDLQTEWGEIPPLHPQAAARSPECGENRINSWNQFWDRVASKYPAMALDLAATHKTMTLGGKPAETWLGKNSGRIALNLGDGKLTTSKVMSAVDEILALRGQALPDLPLVAITAAGYYNNPEIDHHFSSAAALPYLHPDHLAVTNAGVKLADRAKHGAWVVVNPFDPRANEKRVLSRSDYEDYMGLEHDGKPWTNWESEFGGIEIEPGDKPGHYQPFSWIDTDMRNGFSHVSKLREATRQGAYQQYYGWLAFPDPWIPGEYQLANSDVLFARHQFFLHTRSAKGIELSPETQLVQD